MRYRFIQPFLHLLEAERAHGLAIAALKHGLIPAASAVENDILTQELWGLKFKNPVGLAAGFDKNAEAASALLKHGFGFVECGTVTPRPQAGNPKPRVFRLTEDKGVVNRLGFNNKGIDVFLENVPPREGRNGIVGLNIGKNKSTANALDDYLLLLERVYDAADYITVNISSPNTQGLRDLQEKSVLEVLLKTLLKKREELAAAGRKVPLLLKVAPDLTEEECADISEIGSSLSLDGLIVGNTTISRTEGLISANGRETGGLSGRPLFARSTNILKKFYRLTGGKIPLVGVGGISSGEDAYAKIRAGASLVQLYSALIYEGLGLVNRINDDLVRLLQRDGLTNIQEAIGVDAA